MSHTRIAFLLFLAAFAAVPSLSPARAADAAPAAFANEAQRVRVFLADRILDGLQGRDWLVSGTLSFSDALRDRAAARGMELTLVDAPFPALPEAVQERLRTLGDEAVEAASISPFCFASNWMEASPDEGRAHLALLEMPELWRARGGEFITSGLVYLGVKGSADTVRGLDARLEEASAAWDDIGEFLLDSEAEAATPEASGLRTELRVRASRAMNEFGALLESAGMAEEAFDAYSRAYRVYPSNVVALMNKASLVKRGTQTGSQAELVAELNKHNAEAVPDAIRWGLDLLYGPAVHPEDFVPMGWAWALSAVPAAEKDRLEAGLKLVREEARPQLERVLAEGHGRQIGMADTAKRVLEALRKPESRAAAAIAMLRDSGVSGADEKVQGYWRKTAAEAGATETDLVLTDMAVRIARGDAAGAKEVLSGALEKDGENWILRRNLLNLQSIGGDREGVAANVAFLKAHEGAPAGLADMAEGMGLALDGKAAEARAAFLKALEAMPNDLGVLDPLLKLDMQFGEGEAAKLHAEAILAVAPGHAFANYIAGSVALGEGRGEDAVRLLQSSVAADPQPYALNDFACALSALGRYEEAANIAAAALQRVADNPAMYDTYAEALIGLGKWDEAAEAVQKALSLLKGEDPGVFHLREAQILLHQDKRAEAAAALRRAELGSDSFGPAEKKLHDELEKQLR